MSRRTLCITLGGTLFCSSSLSAQPPMFPPVAPPGEMFHGRPPGIYPPPGPVIPPYPPVIAPPVPPPGVFAEFERSQRMLDYAWTHIEPPQPREIKVHDLITILVKEQSETTVNARFNRNRRSTLKAELKEFIRLDDDGNLTNAAEDSPTIDASMNNRFQTEGLLLEREGMIYRIAATVVDVRPNGNVVLEARKSIRSNRDAWEYQLTGEIRAQDIYRDNTALSENIANLQIVKHQRGKVYESTETRWGTRLVEMFFPF